MKIILAICAIALISHSHAQTWPPYRILRYDEDYSFLKNDTSGGWYQKLKYTTINKEKNIYLSAGGDIRYQYLLLSNENWGETPPDDDGFILTRWLAHADLHIRNNVRVFVELQSCMANSRGPAPIPIENNPLELHQAFVDWNISSSPKLAVTLRAGRQEFLFGSQRLVSVRDAPNARQSFDGVNTIFSNQKNQLNLFYANYVVGFDGIFDDRSNTDKRFWGLYFSRKSVPLVRNLDTYYIGYDSRRTIIDDGAGRELRHTFGMRLWDIKSNWKYDLEGAYQGGTLGNKTIAAWGISLITSYTFTAVFLKPELGVKTEIISGNRKYDDNKIETINPLFPQGAYFGLAVPIAPSNLMDIHPTISIRTKSGIRLSLDYAAIWRHSVNDGSYRGNMIMIYSGRKSENKFIGGQLSTTLVYPANRFILLICGFSWFDAQAYLKDVGTGKDTILGFTTVQVKF